ncbi:hypothetical protein OG361_05970 [Streptomyces sp. NBC_00090]|uniref:hypothetical protein n=1 Tax=Streptomyces sp. NBC_00090 TaxID=2903619 RepID=UPI00324B316B
MTRRESAGTMGATPIRKSAKRARVKETRRTASLLGPLRAEMRLAALPALVLGVLVAAAAVTRAVLLYLDGANRGVNGLDKSILALDTPAGALQAAAWQHSSLLGLLFVALIGGVVLAEGLEGGTWSLVRLYQARVFLLVVRKLLIVLFLAALSVIFTAVTLWAAVHLSQALQPPAGPVNDLLPAGQASQESLRQLPDWGKAWEAYAKALLVLSFFATFTACAAAAARAVITGAVLGAGPVAVTLPLVTTDFRAWMPHYWIASWMEFSEDGQWKLYWWSASPGSPNSSTALAVLSLVGVVLLSATWLLLRTERSLSPRA